MEGTNDKRILVFWPGFIKSQIDFFKTLMDNFNLDLIFVANRKGNRDAYKLKKNDYLVLDDKYVDQWDFTEIRARKFTIKDIIILFMQQWNTITKKKYDLIITSTQYPLHSKFAFFIAKLKGIKIAVYTEAWEIVSYMNPLKRLYQRMGSYLVQYSDFCLVQGEFKKRIYHEVFGVNENKLRVLPFLINDYMRNEKLTKNKNKIVNFLFMGRFLNLKGLELLLETFYYLGLKYPDISLTLAGDEYNNIIKISKNMESLIDKYRRDRLLDRVNIVGFLDEHQKKKYFSQTDFFVMPSWEDGWGIVLQEALSAGIPSVVSDRVGAAEDLIDHGKNGFIFKSKDLKSLYKVMEKSIKMDSKNYIKFSLCARRKFEEYNSKEKIVETIAQMIEI